MAHKHVYILGVKVHSTSIAEVLKLFLPGHDEKGIRAGRHRSFFIATPNPEIILAAQKDKELLKALNSADLCIADGVGLKLYGLSVIKGRKLMIEMFKLAQNHNKRVFFLGSTPEVISKCLKTINREYPFVSAAGFSGARLNDQAMPVSGNDQKLNQESLRQINSFKPDFLFVGFGAPKQEKWIYNNLPKLNAGCVMVVGGALDYYAGIVPKVPGLFENLGLEWLWRLINDSSRLGRIINATVVFPLVVLKEKLGL